MLQLQQPQSFVICPDKCIFNQVNAGNQPMRNGALFLAKDGAMALGWQCGTERKPQHFVVHDRQGSRSKESNTMLLRAN